MSQVLMPWLERGVLISKIRTYLIIEHCRNNTLYIEHAYMHYVELRTDLSSTACQLIDLYTYNSNYMDRGHCPQYRGCVTRVTNECTYTVRATRFQPSAPFYTDGDTDTYVEHSPHSLMHNQSIVHWDTEIHLYTTSPSCHFHNTSQCTTHECRQVHVCV